ncbi:hypothetical protein POM88_010340 [Heracleum sosnowskyi]|uniref:RBR-type E3 ubiquitin transferase n=1 Tax=Heracleum sosnowskyi TaxID=360622 RepID=A0AAD8ISE2_9APIA|nr:hypothetical protein POM88_010340 [Heracleum sosnowskyi]
MNHLDVVDLHELLYSSSQGDQERIFVGCMEGRPTKGNGFAVCERTHAQTILIHCRCNVVSNMQCNIGIEKVSGIETKTMDCGHFCNNCWTEHFIVKINEGQIRRVRCMAEKCNEICDEGKVKSLVGARDPVLAEKFDCFLLQSYIDVNKKVKWSHSIPHCGNELRVQDDQYCEVECACGLQTAVLL